VSQRDSGGQPVVASSVGRKEAPVFSQPVHRPGAVVRERTLHGVRVLPVAREGAAQEAAEVAAARHGGEVVDLPDQPLPGERLEETEAEGGAAYASTREGEADFGRVGWQGVFLPPLADRIHFLVPQR